MDTCAGGSFYMIREITEANIQNVAKLRMAAYKTFCAFETRTAERI